MEKESSIAGAARTELVAVDQQLKDLKELKYNLDQYKENLPFHQKYRKSGDPARYMRMHETELILFDGAKRKLLQMGIRPKMSELNKVNSDIEALESKKAELEETYRSSSARSNELRSSYESITQFLDKQKDEAAADKPGKKNRSR
ncbi:MAG: hypothetical protein K6F99_10565 [Lachnospiraceae bacterium]|nr:hypothetical protein [Lachnospiraceae bacterium]